LLWNVAHDRQSLITSPEALSGGYDDLC
jgi:hypothetical protein